MSGQYIDLRERLSEEALEALDECRAKHINGCPCLAGGDPIPRELVIEDHEGFLVVADVAP